MSFTVAQQKKIMTQISKLVSEQLSGADFDHNEVFTLLINSKLKWPKVKAKKDPTKPKQGLSAYIIFTSEIREQTKKENPDFPMTELSKVMGAKWKALTVDEKAPYVTKSDADKVRAKAEIATWEASKSDSGSDSDDGVGVEPKAKAKAKAKAKVKVKVEVKEGSPKKAKNSWQFFQQVKKAKDSNVEQKDLRASWKIMDDKSQFEDMATADKERYATELAEFEANN
jgi:hypothetical protein